MLSGGVLTEESMTDLEDLIKSARGLKNFNRVVILEAVPDSVGLDDKSNVKLDLKNLTDYRKEDQMFGNYIETSEKIIRRTFRIPPLYTGGAETFTHATALAAQTVAEEQVFIPERTDFDEVVNIKLLQDEFDISDWEFRSIGPRIVGAKDMSSNVSAFTKSGAFTINYAVERANEAFGLEMSKFDQDWANFPVSIVLEMVRQGKVLNGMENMFMEQEPVDTGDTGAVGGKAKNTNVIPLQEAVEKAISSENFDDEELAMYSKLLEIQEIIQGDAPDV